MSASTTCPLCQGPHELSQCPRWRNDGKPGQVQASDLRALMPQTAEIVDALRYAFGRPAIDRLLKQAMRGRRVFHAVELGPDGVRREFGRPLGM